MIHIHTDADCQHDLKVCATCGNVYCSKCGKEWYREQRISTPTFTWQPVIPMTVGSYDDTNGTYHLHT